MSTQTKILTATRDWQPLTDGSADCQIQMVAAVELCRSTTRPAAGAPCMTFSRTTLTITAPDVVWIRSAQHHQVPVCVW